MFVIIGTLLKNYSNSTPIIICVLGGIALI